MDLSIVITTYNRAEVLARLLQSLSLQTDRDFQVVVAIDGSTDHTEHMLSTLQLPFDLKWINTHCKGYGLAVARNRGILAAAGRAVVVLDDDSFPDPGFVAAHKRSVTAGVITGGPRNPAESGNQRMAWKMRELARLPALTPMTIPELRRDWPNAYLIENNISLLREDFISMGLFSERLKMYGFIGQEFFGRAEFAGLRYQFNPHAAVIHHGELVGNNGLSLRRKMRETHLAGLIRPSLMEPKHYLAQMAWSRSQKSGETFPMPSFWVSAVIAMPWRLAVNMTKSLKRKIRNRLVSR